MLSRRTVLRLVAASVPAFTVGCAPRPMPIDPDEVPESIERFPRTPIAGDMTSSRVVLAFFVADDSAVTLRMWTGEEVVVDQAIEPSGDGFHKVMIDELEPGTTYTYVVLGGEAPTFENRSLIGQVRTAPAADATPPVRIALAGCIGQGSIVPDFFLPETMSNPTTEPFTWEVFNQAVDHDLDAVIHLGDQAYLDFVWSEQNGEVAAYLHAWGFYHGGGYRDLYPHAGVYATWDDHEATDNGRFDPWDMSEEEVVKLANAQEAWFKVIPIDAMKPGDSPVWRGFQWGGTVELLLLDCRYELTPDQLVSEEQLQWLLDRIQSSPCRFVCVATPKPFASITSSTALMQDNADRWEAHPDQRERVAELIDSLQQTGVLFVTGDIHMNYLGRLSLEGEAPSERGWEVCCTSGNSNPLADSLSLDQFNWVSDQPHLPVITFDAEAETVHVAFFGSDGSLAFEQTIEDL